MLTVTRCRATARGSHHHAYPSQPQYMVGTPPTARDGKAACHTRSATKRGPCANDPSDSYGQPSNPKHKKVQRGTDCENKANFCVTRRLIRYSCFCNLLLMELLAQVSTVPQDDDILRPTPIDPYHPMAHRCSLNAAWRHFAIP